MYVKGKNGMFIVFSFLVQKTYLAGLYTHVLKGRFATRLRNTPCDIFVNHCSGERSRDYGNGTFVLIPEIWFQGGKAYYKSLDDVRRSCNSINKNTLR